jgi:hypothetical protein
VRDFYTKKQVRAGDVVKGDIVLQEIEGWRLVELIETHDTYDTDNGGPVSPGWVRLSFESLTRPIKYRSYDLVTIQVPEEPGD